MQRRSLITSALGAVALGVSTLAGCGFQLRRPPELQLKRIYLGGFDRYSVLADELRSQLRASPGVVLTEAASQSDLVLRALADVQEQVAAASTAAGLVTEMTLRTRFTFEVRNAGGQLLIAASTLSLSRDMSYSETRALAKEQEAQLMFRAMQRDIANQVLRRLAALPAVQSAVSAASAASR